MLGWWLAMAMAGLAWGQDAEQRALFERIEADGCEEAVDDVLAAVQAAGPRRDTSVGWLAIRGEVAVCLDDLEALEAVLDHAEPLLDEQTPYDSERWLLEQRLWLSARQEDAGRMAAARQALLTLATAHEGPDAPYVVTLLVHSAQDARQAGDFERGKALLDQAAAVLGDAVPEDLPSLDNRLDLGLYYYAFGEIVRAREVVRPLMDCCETMLADNPSLAAGLYNILGSVFPADDEVLVWFERLRALYDSGALEPDELLLQALTNEAITLGELGRHAEAAQVLEEVVTRVDQLSPDTDEFRVHAVRALLVRANIAWNQGKHVEAEAALQALLARVPPDDGDRDALRSRAAALHRLSERRLHQGLLEEATALSRESLVLVEQLFGPEHSSVAERLQVLARLSADAGAYVEAFRLWQRAEQILIARQGPDSSSLVTLWNNESLARVEVGDTEGAVEALIRARDWWLDHHRDHPTAYTVRLNLANALMGEGRLEEAAAELEEVERGAELPRQKEALLAIRSGLRRRQGRLDEALADRRASLALYEAGESVNRFTTTTKRLELAGLYLEREELDAAQRELDEAWAGRSDPEHWDLQRLDYEGLRARLRLRKGDAAAARTMLRETALAAGALGEDLLPGLAEGERLGLIGTLRAPLRYWLAVTHEDAADAELWQLHGRLWATDQHVLAQHRQLVQASRSAQASALARELVVTRRALSEVAMDPARALELGELQRQRLHLERSLAREVPVSVPEADVDAVCAALRPDEALVEYTIYPALPEEGGAGRGSAWVLLGGPDCGLERVALPGLAPRESMARGLVFGAGLPGSERALHHGRRLFDYLWAPLAEALDGRSRVWVVPGAHLTTVPLAALPDATGRLVVEDFTLGMLPSAATLLERPTGTELAVDALIVGNVNYGDGSRDGPCDLPLRFEPLPGTADEIGALQQLYRKHRPESLVGDAVTESRLEQAIAGRGVVHLATHGFYTLPGCEGRVSAELSARASSGVVLAGVNRPVGEAGDGLWTAAEVAAMDLDEAQLVLLSACSAGRGMVTGGGVVGIQRAFTVAGAQTLVAALWAVEDHATSALMVGLHRARLRQQLSGAEALRQAQLALLERSRERYREPMFHQWAAFQASGPGALGPLERKVHKAVRADFAQ